jgi:hypothetical protein
MTRGQYVLVAIGIVIVLVAAYFILMWATARPNLEGTVTVSDGTSVRPLAGAQLSLVSSKYGAVAHATTDAKGHYSLRAEVTTYKINVLPNCPYIAHRDVTLSLGQVVQRDVACLTQKP